MKRIDPRLILPGLLLCIAIAAYSKILGSAFPAVGAAIFALSSGLIFRAFFGSKILETKSASIAFGATFASKPILQIAIVFLGAKTSLGRVAEVGAESLIVMLVSLCVAFLTAWFVGRALRVEAKLATLIGTGTAICGGSAIAAAAPVIGADESDTAYAFSVIFAFNLAAVFLFPALGSLMGLSDSGFGLWAGTAINDTSSVVAAGYAWSATAGDYAVVVKLARTAMIVPVTLVLGALAGRGYFDRHMTANRSSGNTESLRKTIDAPSSSQAAAFAEGKRKAAPLPWFIFAFLGASLARSIGLIPALLGSKLAEIGVFLIAVALAGIGLSTDFRRIARTGWKPLLLGFAVWVAVAFSSLGIQALMGRG